MPARFYAAGWHVVLTGVWLVLHRFPALFGNLHRAVLLVRQVCPAVDTSAGNRIPMLHCTQLCSLPSAHASTADS